MIREKIYRGVAQSGSVSEWGSEGRWFKSSRPDHLKELKGWRISPALLFFVKSPIIFVLKHIMEIVFAEVLNILSEHVFSIITSLKNDPAGVEEWNRIADALTVPETFFWREPNQSRYRAPGGGRVL